MNNILVLPHVHPQVRIVCREVRTIIATTVRRTAEVPTAKLVAATLLAQSNVAVATIAEV